MGLANVARGDDLTVRVGGTRGAHGRTWRNRALGRSSNAPYPDAEQSRNNREREQSERNPALRGVLGGDSGSDPLAELRAQFAALQAALPAPSLENFLNTEAFDVAEAQARDTYAKAKPVLAATLEQLQQVLGKSEVESDRRHQQTLSNAKALDQQVSQEADVIADMAAKDLALQAGDNVVSALVNDQAFEAAAAQQAASANSASHRQLLADMKRAEDESLQDRQNTAEIVNAAANADAQNNLDAILNEIGLGRAQAEAQGRAAFEEAQGQYGQRQAELGFQRWQMEQEFRAQQDAAASEQVDFLREEAMLGQEMEQARRSATAEMALGVQNQALEMMGDSGGRPDPARFAQIASAIIQQNATSWKNGNTPQGIAIDPRDIRDDLQAFVASLMAANEGQ